METRQEPETKNNKFCFSSEYKTPTFHKFKRMSKESRTSLETAVKIQDHDKMLAKDFFLLSSLLSSLLLKKVKKKKKKRRRQQHGV